MSKSEFQFDEIGYWSELKLDIIREYASAYSRILAAQKNPRFDHVYIDAFAGAGTHISKSTGEFVSGSPRIALDVIPPFTEYHFIDIDGRKVDLLERMAGDRADVRIHEGDCNTILLQRVFPRVKRSDYRRGLCILDPYGLDLEWQVIQTAGQLGTLDVFLNFPVMDMNRNVLWKNPSGVSSAQKDRLNRYWGDSSWESEVYDGSRDLFGHESKVSNEDVAERFRERLRKVAGFSNVPAPIPMRNEKGSVVYFLFFASQKSVAGGIVKDIFAKYRLRMVQ